MNGYDIYSLDELGAYPDLRYEGGPQLIPVRYELGLRAFGANAWTNDVGGHVVPKHSESSGNEELYVVVRGSATFTVDERTFDAPAGTLVHVGGGETREAVAREPGTIVLAVGATRGEAFEAHGWDEVVVAFTKARGGDVAGSRAMVDALLARQPGEWQGPYNAACFEALFGDTERAFAHLARALEMAAPEVREFAVEDSDLSSLHDDPRWQELTAP